MQYKQEKEDLVSGDASHRERLFSTLKADGSANTTEPKTGQQQFLVLLTALTMSGGSRF
jgi:hypothetical protein